MNTSRALVLQFIAGILMVSAALIHAAPETPEEIARKLIAPQIDPVKVATLKGDRPANARLYRVLYWLETAHQRGGDVSRVLDIAQEAAGYAGTKGAEADKIAITWNRKKLEEFGCFTPDGMAKLRKGGSPKITKGEHVGDSIALDHVLPRAIVKELEARFYNLEAIPARQNLAKSANLTEREINLARRWHREGLLSAEGLANIEQAAADPARK